MSSKPFKTHEEQLLILKDRGLIISDEATVRHILKHHNYYRLSAYRFPLQDSPDIFNEGTTFEELWGLYCFDRILRGLVSEACKMLEVSVRAHWAYVLGERYGPQAYECLEVFCDLAAVKKRETSARNLIDNLASLDKELSRSKEVFVTHHRFDKKVLRPPIWAISEVMSFGLLSRFYDGIIKASDKKAIAQSYNLSDDGLRSILQHAVYLRNLCAHHSRLWNRKLTVNVSLPRKQPSEIISSFNFQEEKRIYNSLILLGYIVCVIAPESDWKKRLILHMNTLDSSLHREMGFPSDWRNRDFWLDT